MRGTAALIVAILVLLPATGSRAQGTRPATPLTVISRDGRRTLPTTLVGGQEMVSLDDIAALFQASVRDDAIGGGAMVTIGGRTIVVSADQPMASVNGRVVALPSPLVRASRRRLVPIEFIPRAIGPISDQRIDLRRPSRLLILGNLRVPRVTARIDTAGPPTRASVDIDPVTPITSTNSDARLVLHIQADAIDFGATVPGVGMIEQIRAEQNTVVVELRPGAGAARVTSTGTDGGTHVAIEVNAPASSSGAPSSTASSPTAPPRDGAATPAPRAPAAPIPSTAAPLPLPMKTGLQVVVIDPGHGGDDSGVRGARGTLEKTITLDIARRLRTLIETQLGIKVVLTREDDRAVGIDERAAIANNNKADLFLSLHANASPSPTAAGAEIYRLRVDDQVDEARRASAAEAVTLPAVGGGTRRVGAIRWDLAQARHVDESIALSGLLRESLTTHGVLLSVKAERQAPLRVLEAADMPAALIEIAYLTNPDQEQSATSDDFQNAVAQAVYDAVVRFRNQPPTP